MMISKSYQDIRVGTREEESLEMLSEDREWLCRCDVEWKVVPQIGAGKWERPSADCRVEWAVLLDDERQKTAAVVLMSCRRHGWKHGCR